ncbi:DUF6776 family protein [Marinimicrobium sp. ABcell2]|uniref:DUF6776 family protein n=1 Tax=Marinimicrobium sp. ABcell2 TaxID=3069751 RepID=UPI0027AF5C56|nr:DUF6776 family protein [Marinimicrobium sp. ABcell2]MDQ2075720.1 hypothetical protein [Marinimicrobium sp. ABcell2]
MAVKGSKQPLLVVVPYRPVRTIVLWLSVIILGAALVAASFYWGFHQGSSIQAGAVTERNELRKQVAALTAESEALQQQVVNLRLGSQVDHKASEQVRSQVIALKEEITALQEDISFYRGIMAPEKSRSGLVIGSLNVIGTGVPRQYEYKVVVQQLATNHQVLAGHLNFNIIGWRNGEQETIPLHQLSEQVDGANIRLRFRYFQNIEGRLMLPDDFEPERIELTARSSGNNPQTAEKKFGWLVQEI